MDIRKLMSLLLCFAMLFALCACDSRKTEEVYADQEQFLQDMADGITSRLETVDDSTSRTDEEMAVYYQELVACELDEIEKYEDQTFEDETFDSLAHAYIDACQLQRIYAENYRNKDLKPLWTDSTSIRSAIITELYVRYGLPLTAEQAAEYSAGSSGNVQYTASLDGDLDLSTGLTMYYDDMVTYDTIKLHKADHQTLFDNGDITVTLKSLEHENGNHTINMTIHNSLKSDKVTCYVGSGSIDDYQISMYHPWGYIWAKAGKICDTYSHISDNDLKDIGKEDFTTLSAFLYVITSDGSTGQYIAKIPLIISRDAFE